MEKKIMRNRPRSLGKRKVINLLTDPVGVISVDGQARILHFDSDRPLKSIVVVKRVGGLWQLACEVGLRRRRPYGLALRFWDWQPTTTFTREELAAVLPLLFQMLRGWVEQGTARWVTWSQFAIHRGSRPQRGTAVHAASYHGLRFLMVTIAYRDAVLLRLFRRLSDYTLFLQRGAGMERTLSQILRNPNESRYLRDRLGRFFPELHLVPIRQSDLFLLALLFQNFPLNNRLSLLYWLVGKRQHRGEIVSRYARYMRRLIEGGILTSFMRQADALLGVNAILLRKDWPRRGYTVFRYSLNRLIRKTP